jgi:hypothetical protein
MRREERRKIHKEKKPTVSYVGEGIPIRGLEIEMKWRK